MFAKKLFKSRKDRRPVRRRAVISDSTAPDDGAKATGRHVFQRNRTITGSLSSSIDTPEASRSSDLKSPRIKTHHLRHRRRKIGTLLFVLLGAVMGPGVLLANVIVSPQVEIKDYSSQAVAKECEESIRQYLINHPTERILNAVNTATLTQHVQNDIPDVKSVAMVSKNKFGTAKFQVTLRRPIVLWHAKDKDVYVDGEGAMFNRNLLGNPVVSVEDKTGITVDNSQQAIVSGRFLQFIGKAAGYFEASGYKVDKVVLPPATARQIVVSLESVSSAIKMSTDRPAAGQVEDAVRSIVYLQKQGASAEYIDVRVGRRAYYK